MEITCREFVDLSRTAPGPREPNAIGKLYDAIVRLSKGTEREDDLTAVIIKRL